MQSSPYERIAWLRQLYQPKKRTVITFSLAAWQRLRGTTLAKQRKRQFVSSDLADQPNSEVLLVIYPRGENKYLSSHIVSDVATSLLGLEY